MKDEDRGESCDPFLPEHEPDPQLDGLDESTHFSPLNKFFILYKNFQQQHTTGST
jgi:hypothetical protein